MEATQLLHITLALLSVALIASVVHINALSYKLQINGKGFIYYIHQFLKVNVHLYKVETSRLLERRKRLRIKHNKNTNELLSI